ncbi:MAG: hypothetical protein ACTHLB_04825 [Parafilimonas sp.]|jgi:hypothetical protein
MKRLFTFIFFIVGQILYGQTKNIQVPVYREKDTTLWYIWTKDNIQKIGLQDLTKTTQPFHFRFWTERQAIDIWTTDNKTFEGKFISYTKEYDPDKYKTDEPKPEKFFSKIDAIDTATARKIYEFAYQQGLFEVPFQDSIKGWSNGTDGDTYLVEYATSTDYSFKDYWTPQIQKGISEAAIIDTVYKYLIVTLNMNNTWSSFINSLPKGCYHAGSLFITCNNVKPKKKKNRS